MHVFVRALASYVSDNTNKVIQVDFILLKAIYQFYTRTSQTKKHVKL